MRAKRFILTVGVALFSFCALASTKVGVVNIQEVVKNMPERATVVESLKKELQSKQAKLSTIEEGIQKIQKQIERDKAILSEKEMDGLKDKFIGLQRDFARKKKAFQEDLAALENKEMQNLFKKAANAVDAYAKANNYDLILRRSAAPFFVSQKVDITQDIVKALSQ